MPWNAPDGEVAGELKSAWASIHSSARSPSRRSRLAAATARSAAQSPPMASTGPPVLSSAASSAAIRPCAASSWSSEETPSRTGDRVCGRAADRPRHGPGRGRQLGQLSGRYCHPA